MGRQEWRELPGIVAGRDHAEDFSKALRLLWLADLLGPKEWPPAISGEQHLLASDFTKSHQPHVMAFFDRGKQVYFQNNSEGWTEYRVTIPAGDTRIGWMHLNHTKALWGKKKEWDVVLPKTNTVRLVFPPERGVAVKWIELNAKGNIPPAVRQIFETPPESMETPDEPQPLTPFTTRAIASAVCFFLAAAGNWKSFSFGGSTLFRFLESSDS